MQSKASVFPDDTKNKTLNISKPRMIAVSRSRCHPLVQLRWIAIEVSGHFVAVHRNVGIKKPHSCKDYRSNMILSQSEHLLIINSCEKLLKFTKVPFTRYTTSQLSFCGLCYTHHHHEWCTLLPDHSEGQRDFAVS